MGGWGHLLWRLYTIFVWAGPTGGSFMTVTILRRCASAPYLSWALPLATRTTPGRCVYTPFYFAEVESCLISHIRMRVEIHQEAVTDPSSPPGEWIGDASFSPGEAGNGIYFSKSVAISPKREPSPLDSPPADGACSMIRSAMREKGMLWR